MDLPVRPDPDARYQHVGNNTVVGVSAFGSGTSGSNNVAIGTAALKTLTTANQNTGVGIDTFYYNATSNLNTGVGSSAGYYQLGQGNTAVGAYALFGASER